MKSSICPPHATSILRAFAILSIHLAFYPPLASANPPTAILEPIAQWPKFSLGIANAVRLQNGIAYIANTNGLAIIDCRDPLHPSGLGGIDSVGNAVDLAITNGIAFLATGAKGLQIVDVREPASPHRISGIQVDGGALRLSISSGHAYVASGAAGWHVIDIVNGALPKHLATYKTPGFATSILAKEDRVYVADATFGLLIYNVADPKTPSLLGTYAQSRGIEDIEVLGKIAYLASRNQPGGRELLVLDVQRPAEPRLLSTYNGETGFLVSPLRIVADSNRIYMLSGHALVVADTTNQNAVRAVGATANIGYPVHLSCEDQLCAVASGEDGVYIVQTGYATSDISSVVTQSLGSGGVPIKSIAVAGDVALAAGPTPGLHLIDASNPKQLLRLATEHLPARHLALSSNTVYASTESAELHVLELRGASNMVHLGLTVLPGLSESLVARSNIVFVAAGKLGMILVDANETGKPKLLSIYDTRGFASDIAVAHTNAYIADDAEIEIVDISVLSQPRFVRRSSGRCRRIKTVGQILFSLDDDYLTAWRLESQGRFMQLGSFPPRGWFGGSTRPKLLDFDVVGDLCCVLNAEGQFDILEFSGQSAFGWRSKFLLSERPQRLSIANGHVIAGGGAPSLHVAALTNAFPAILSQQGLTGEAVAVGADSGKAVLATRFDGVHLLDTSIPTHPRLLGSLDGIGRAYDAAVSKDRCYIAAGGAGLRIVDIGERGGPRLLSTYTFAYGTPTGTALAVAIEKNRAYLASGPRGLEIVDISQPDRPVRIGSLPVGASSFETVAVSGSLVYVGSTDGSNNSISVYDVSDPQRIKLMGGRPVWGHPQAFALSSGIGCVALGTNGVEFFNPQNGIRISALQELGVAQDVVFLGSLAFVADRTGNIAVVDVRDPTRPSVLAREHASTAANGIAVDGNSVFVANGAAGLTVYTSGYPVILDGPSDRIASLGDDVVLSVTTAGSVPLSYDWLRDGVLIPQAAQPALKIDGIEQSHEGAYSVIVRNGFGSVTSRIAHITVRVDLGVAVEAPQIEWRTGGREVWVGQGQYSRDGVDSGMSGKIGDSAVSWMETTLIGPGRLSFWSAVSSAADDGLEFWLSGDLLSRRSGISTNWVFSEFLLRNGRPVIAHWRYAKDSSGSAGADAAWVDGVRFQPLDRVVEVRFLEGLAGFPRGKVIEGSSIGIEAEVFLRDQPERIRYQWVRNGTPLNLDPDTRTLRIDGARPIDAGTYSVSAVVELGGGAETLVLHSDSITVEVLPGPRITATPASPVVSGSRVVMSVEVPGVPALSGIQWYAPDGWPIPGASQSTLVLPAVTFDDAGEYRVEVDYPDSPSKARSSPYRLSVYPAVAGPKVVTHPQPQVGHAGGRAVFTVGASGTPPFGYRWYKGNTEITGATNFFLVLTNLVAGDAGAYRAVVSNPAGTSSSSAATLSLVPSPTADATYESWVAQGRASLTNQTAASLANAVRDFTRARERFPAHPDANLLLGMSRFFDVAHGEKAKGFLDRLAFSSRERDIYDWGSSAPVNGQGEITSPPGVDLSELSSLIREEILPAMMASGTNLSAVTSADFLMRLSASETTLTDVWLDRADVLTIRAGLKLLEFLLRTTKSWDLHVPLAAIEALLRDPGTTLEAIRSNYPGLLDFEDVTQIAPAQAALEAAVDLYVQAAGTLHARTPGSERLFNVWREDEPDEARLRQALLDIKASLAEAIVVNEDPVWRIQWGRGLDGAQSPRQMAPAFVGDHADPASVSSPVFRGGLGASGRPRVLFPPIDREAKAGARVELAVIAAGSEPLHYEWRKDDRVLPGATSARLVIPALSGADVGRYSVVVRNAHGDETTVADVSIVRPPTLLSAPSSVTATAGGGTLLRVEAAGSEPLRFQWYRDGRFLPGETGPELHLRDVRAEDQGSYVARVSNAGGEVFTSPVSVAVAPIPGGFSPPLFEDRYDDTGFVGGPQRTLHDGEGGIFTYYVAADVADSHLLGSPVRLHEGNGSPDYSARPFGFGGHVGAMALQQDGKLLLAASREGTTVIARFERSGLGDPSFRSFAIGRAIRFITVQPDGRILLAATDSETPHPIAVQVPDTTLLRLESDGTLDASFHPPTIGRSGEAMIYAPPVVDDSGRIYLGGRFQTVDGQPRTNLARLQPDGTVDMAFSGLTGVAGGITSSQVRGIGIQSDGRIVVAGDFRIPTTASSSETLAAVRFLPNGQFDASFARTRLTDAGIVPPGVRARAMVLLPDDRVLLVANTLVRLDRNGALDRSLYQPRFGEEAFWISRAADGRLFVPGLLSVDGEPVGSVAAFTADGRPIPSFGSPRAGQSIFPLSLASLPGDRLVVGGRFNMAAGQRQVGTAILESDGRLAFRQYHVGREQRSIQRVEDSVVTEGPHGTFYCLETVLGFEGMTWRRLLRIGDDGEVDDTFRVEPLEFGNLLRGPTGLFGEPDGSLLVVGGANGLTVVHTNYLRRLRADGTEDPAFLGVGRSLAAELGLQRRSPDNALQEIVAGSLRIHARDTLGRYLASVHAIDGSARVTRLLLDGAEDPDFVRTQPEGRTTPIATYEQFVDPLTPRITDFPVTAYRDRLITDVLPLPDGRILVSGRFSRYAGVDAAGLVRLSIDGTVDTTFSVGTGPRFPGEELAIPFIDSLGLDGQARVFVAGRFSAFDGVPSPGVVRLLSDGRADPHYQSPVRVLDYDGAAARLKRLGNRLFVAGTVGLTNDVLPRAALAIDATAGPTLHNSPPAEILSRQGERLTLEVRATGSPPITYQWQRDEISIPGAIHATLTLESVGLSNAGRYTVIVRDATGEVTSPISVVRVLPVVPPDSLAFTADGHVTFSLDVLAGSRVVVESSDDLRTWRTVVESVPAQDRISITDSEPPAPQGRFYRAKYYLP